MKPSGEVHRGLAILGLGTAVPPVQITQDVAAEVTKHICNRVQEYEDMMLGFYRNAGIHTRHTVLERQVICDILEGTFVSGSPYVPPPVGDYPGPTTGQRMEHYRRHAPQLALAAAARALEDSGTEASAIGHLITVSCTGFSAPGLDVSLIKNLGMPATVGRTHVGFMGCHGALNGLRVATALASASPGTRVLLCAVETCSLHFQYNWNPRKLVANALFADGAAAVVGAAVDGPYWRVADCASFLFPDSQHAMTWDIGDNGFEMTLFKGVPELIQERLGGWLRNWLAEHALVLDDVASWAVHPGGPRILEAVESALGLNEQALAHARAVLSACGNMSSPTILFILDRMRRLQAPRPCVALAFGPGLVAEAALLV